MGDGKNNNPKNNFSELDARIDKYWGEIYPLDFTQDLNPQIAILNEKLLPKYGKEIMNEFKRLEKGFVNGCDKDKDRFIEFAYETGLYWDVSPSYSLGGREIMKMIAKELPQYNPKKILDAGCGDMKITAGLALFFPEINILGIDKCVPAIDRANDVISSLKKSYSLDGRIIAEHNDFLDEKIISKIKKYDPELIVLLRPSEVVETSCFAKKMLDENRKVIGCFSLPVSDNYDIDEYVYSLMENINYGVYNTYFNLKKYDVCDYQLTLFGEFK